MTQYETSLDLKPDYVTLDELFYGKLFRIPQYQRNYSWETKQRNDLFEDIRRTRDIENDKPHFMATVVGLQRGKKTIRTKAHDIIEIVDGQQRITTLVILLKSISRVLNRSDEDQDKIANDLESLLVKDDKTTLLLLQTNHNSSNHFANYIRKGTHESPDNATTLSDKELLSCIEECENFVSDWSKKGDSMVDLVSLLKNRLTFLFHKINGESLVYTVFEVLNSRGLLVPWFDRLKSIFMAIIFESSGDNKDEPINEVHNLWSQIYDIVGKRIGLSAESLRFVATLDSDNCPSKPLSEEQATDHFRKKSEGITNLVTENSNWIMEVTKAVDKLVSNHRISAVTEIAQARLVATSILLRSDFSDKEQSTLLRRWENVTFRIYGMQGKDARNSVGKYVKLAWRIRKEKLSPQDILHGLTEIGFESPIDKAVDGLREEDCYCTVYLISGQIAKRINGGILPLHPLFFSLYFFPSLIFLLSQY